jgi:mannose-6-phosphate isomerase-like protein (cupin superfamily)
VSYPPVRWTAPEGAVSASLRPAGRGPDLRFASGGTVHYLATTATTSGEYGLYRWEMGPEPSGPAPHFHRTISEAFYVLTGTVQLYDGSRTVEARPGDYLYVPPGGVHAFRNESGAPASMLLLFAPGAPREAYFEELADLAAAGRQLSEQQWSELLARHDQYPVTPS